MTKVTPHNGKETTAKLASHSKIRLHPLSFKKFLMATGNERFAELLEKQS